MRYRVTPEGYEMEDGMVFMPYKKETAMHTKDRLAEELTKLGLNAMAKRAAEGYYDDFLSPLPDPITQLIVALRSAEESGAEGAGALARRAMNGDFDATIQESEAWADSPDGRSTFSRLLGGRS